MELNIITMQGMIKLSMATLRIMTLSISKLSIEALWTMPYSNMSLYIMTLSMTIFSITTHIIMKVTRGIMDIDTQEHDTQHNAIQRNDTYQKVH